MPTPAIGDNATGLLTTIYATDEHLAIKARGDYLTLCPEWQTRAAGADGVFDVLAPWVLTSATVDFEALGVQPGNVVHLSAPKPNFPGGGQLLVVDSVAAGAVTLRRVGEPSGVGQPPAPAGAVGVVFKIPTMGAQLEEASFQLNAKWGLDPKLPNRTPTLAYDLRVLRAACVLKVLYDGYSSERRGNDGDFPAKLQQVANELREATSLITIRWGPTGDSQPSSNNWGGRIVR